MKKRLSYMSFVFAAVLAGCTSETPMVNLGVDDTYYVYRMQKLRLQPALTGSEYRWTQIRPDGTEMVVSNDQEYIFLAEDEGVYTVVFDIIDSETPLHVEFTVNVLHEEVEYSPYISRVYEYCPAPGQYVNEMPRYEAGDTYVDILEKVEESICGTNDVLISLGGFGGFVTFGFDHTVVNHPGEYDFRIWGNAFYEVVGPDRKGGSSEPGIVMVSYDVNCNGLPDDEWYELAGSDYHNPLTKHGYSITYHRPEPSSETVTPPVGMGDDKYILWTDSDGQSGYIPKTAFHSQDYYPKWVAADYMMFSGSCLPSNAEDTSGKGSHYVLYSFDWGYVDNHPNDYADLNSFDISWAVDAFGISVLLPGVDFIRVYTGVNQVCGWLGETSTELCRVQDLHIAIAESQIIKK